MKAELDTLTTALHAKTDDLLKASRHLAPSRPAVRIAPRLTDAELVTLAMTQAVPGFTAEAGRLRHARVMRRILALTAAIRHKDHTRQPVLRSLAAYDH